MDHSKHLTEKLLARRWGISPRTLERWRHLAEGPPYVKLGKRVVYALDEVQAFEAMRRRPATQVAGAPQ